MLTRNDTQSNDENIQFVNNVEKLTKNLLTSTGSNIWLVGGAEIITTFMNLGFIDEIIPSIIPVVLGSGIPLFNNIQKETKFQLIKTAEYDALVELHYKVLK